jgi:hypothetical protein
MRPVFPEVFEAPAEFVTLQSDDGIGAALTSRLQSFEAELLAEEETFAGRASLNRALIGRVEALDSGFRTILDMDSTEISVYGEREHSTVANKPVGFILLWLGMPKWKSWIARCKG